MSLAPAGSNWVDGDRFFDRVVELAELRVRVRDGIHTLITAQRRMGKTSLLRELLRRLDEEGETETVFADLEGANTIADAIAEIATAARAVPRARSEFKAMLGSAARRIESIEAFDLRVRLRAQVDAGNWQRKGEALFEAFEKPGNRVVLAIDELPILVARLLRGGGGHDLDQGRRDTDVFMGWLRKMAQTYRGTTLILAGSIGLLPVLRRAGLSAHANVYQPLDLPPWGDETVAACLGELAATQSVCFPRALRLEVYERLRCGVPHHVQQFFFHLHERLRRSGRSRVEEDDIDVVYKEMLGVRGQFDLAHYEDRLGLILDEEERLLALELLTEAAIEGGVLTSAVLMDYLRNGSDAVRHVLFVLEHDGYLESCGNDHRFVSGLLEDWWRARHGQTFVPIRERRS